MKAMSERFDEQITEWNNSLQHDSAITANEGLTTGPLPSAVTSPYYIPSNFLALMKS